MNGRRSSNSYPHAAEVDNDELPVAEDSTDEIVTSEFESVGTTDRVVNFTVARISALLRERSFKLTEKWIRLLAEFQDEITFYEKKQPSSSGLLLNDPVKLVISFLEDNNISSSKLDDIEFNYKSYFAGLELIHHDLSSNEPEKVIKRLAKSYMSKSVLESIPEDEGLNLKGIVRKFYEKVDLVPSFQGGGDTGRPVTVYFELAEK